MLTLSKLYAIADQEALNARGVMLRTFAEDLATSGVTLLQYRNKGGSPQEVLAGAAVISEAFRGIAATLVMNDRADLAGLAGWRAVHVGQGDLPPAAVRTVLGCEASVVGVSTHTEDQVRSAELESPDYIAIGPVFATGSKADAEPPIGIEGVRRARALTRRPLVAIGGITRVSARQVLDAGADSVAMIGALLTGSERPGKLAAELLDLLR